MHDRETIFVYFDDLFCKRCFQSLNAVRLTARYIWPRSPSSFKYNLQQKKNTMCTSKNTKNITTMKETKQNILHSSPLLGLLGTHATYGTESTPNSEHYCNIKKYFPLLRIFSARASQRTFRRGGHGTQTRALNASHALQSARRSTRKAIKQYLPEKCNWIYKRNQY